MQILNKPILEKNQESEFCMSNIIRTTTELAMYTASAYIRPGAVLIDATCGNGHDTLRLAQHKPSVLYAFDMQQDAIDSTHQLLISEGFENDLADGTIKLICSSHEYMSSFVNEKADLIMFNLGYLPGGDKTVTTCAGSTLTAVSEAVEILAADGLVCITMYSGHDEGKTEKEALLNFARQLDSSRYHSAYVSMINQKNSPPELLLITRKK